MLNIRHIALGAVVVLAACTGDSSGPTTPTELAPADGTADAKATSGIRINLAADDGAETTIQFFETFGRKLSDFALMVDDPSGITPSSIFFNRLGAGVYSFQAEPVEGFFIRRIDCTASDGSTAVESSFPQTIDITLTRKGLVDCTFLISPNP